MNSLVNTYFYWYFSL